jgi:uncharacterized delta-60 repeat protein
MRQSLLTSIFSGILILLFGLQVLAGQAGALDTTFGMGGTVRHNIQNGGGNAVAVQADGKVILAGSGNSQFVLVRFNADGTLDNSFGINGMVRTKIFAVDDLGSSARDLIIQPDGKIIAVGNGQRGAFFPPGTPVYNEVTVVRYNPNGSLDTTFDGDGIATTLVNGESSFGYDSELQADGKIVVADNRFSVIRYNSNGSLDASFGTGGIVPTAFGGGNSPNTDLKLQPNGKIVVISGQGLVAMARYNTDGSFDTTFDGDGKLTASIAGYDSGYGLAIQPDGRMVAVAISQTTPSAPQTLGLMRIMPNGEFDASFGNGGKMVAPANFGVGLDIALQADGKIITAGIGAFVFSPRSSDFGVARFLPNGSPDTSFDGDGMALINILPEDTARAVVIQPNGKIVVGGQSSGGGMGVHLSAARIQTIPDTFADFDGDSKSDFSIFRPSNGQWWFLRSSDNSNYALQFGTSTDKIVPADYTGDGKTDVALYRPSSGEWFILRSEDFSYYAFPFGNSTDIPSPGDYDGDGKADPAVFRASTGTWYINNSTSGGTQITNFGTNGDVPVSGDFDGDSRADIAVFRRNTLDWWILRSSNGTVFGYNFGAGQQISINIVPGDYTGDGKADAAFIRDNNWYILRSEPSPNENFYVTAFGIPGDIPTPGDYDGDGRFDIAVFRPSEGVWYVKSSTAGVFQTPFGTSGDLPVPTAYTR